MEEHINTPGSSSGNKYSFTIIIALIMSIVIVMFTLQNAVLVNIKFLMWKVDAPLSLVLFLTLFSGVVISLLFSIPGWFKKRKVISRLKKEIKLLKNKNLNIQ